MKVPQISIVIPTYNRNLELENLIVSLLEMIPESYSQDIEVVISDNCSNEEIHIDETILKKLNCKIVRPTFHLNTAEENLLFSLQHASGVYCWILGDNDLPLQNGVNQLFELCESNKYDLMIFNSLGFNKNSRKWDISRLNLEKYLEEFDLRKFIMIMGFWSIPAGFSTLVFKREAFNLNFMRELHSEGLYIYSHVTTLIKSFAMKKFAAISIPLVKYSSNSFDDESISSEEKSKHWVNYSLKSGKSFRDPWTVSFLKQVQKLEQEGLYFRNDLFFTLDQGHLGQRFFILDSIIAFLADQLVWEESNEKAIRLSSSDFDFVFNLLTGINKMHDVYLTSLNKLFYSKRDTKRLKGMIEKLSDSKEQLDKRYVTNVMNGKIFTTPYGFVWTPFDITLDKIFWCTSKPTNAIYADNLDILQLKIARHFELNPFNHLQNFQTELNVQGLNHQIMRFDSIVRLFPKGLRRLIKWIASKR